MSFRHSMLTSLTSEFDERQWVEQIRRTLEEELEEETVSPVTIFGVPRALMISDPDSYIPQQVAIGPYHHLRPELYEMERYKVAAAKSNLKDVENVQLQHLVGHLIKRDLYIRACYHRHLSLHYETLAWMMAVDASFLLEFLQVRGIVEGKLHPKTPSIFAQLINLSGNKTAHNTTLRDIIMLENQIPLLVLRKLLEMKFSSEDLADEKLFAMLIGLSKDLSPFKMSGSCQTIEISKCAHLLDFLYRFIVPINENASSAVVIEVHDVEEGEDKKKGVEGNVSFSNPAHLWRLLDITWKLLSSMKTGPAKWIKSKIFSKPLKVIGRLPWTFLNKIPIIKKLKNPVENIFDALEKDKMKKDEQESCSNSNNVNNPDPLQEERAIPSVVQLLGAGVQFLPTHEGISSINFDTKTLTFYIPIIELDVNSEVVLRNLVAYEACSASGSLFLSRYVELMNGIIDTDVDAKVFCKKGIIINHLKSEKEVADLWNGMSKSVRLTQVPSLDKVIADVNNYYEGRWKVKLVKFMSEYVFASWRILTFLAAVAMLMLMCLQAFCEVYSCRRLLPIKALEPTTTTNL